MEFLKIDNYNLNVHILGEERPVTGQTSPLIKKIRSADRRDCAS